MAVPLNQALRVGAYVVKQHLLGRKRYPLVLMLEPLFRCNLACAGCGKIDYPAEILNQRLSVAECMEAVDECGAPVVVIAGGEPLLHREIEQIVEGAIARKKFVIVCTNALLLEKKMDLFKPSKWFSWSVHLDGAREEHDISVCQDGVYDRAVAAIAASEAARLPHHHQRHAVRQRRAGAGRGVLRRRDGDGGGRDFASRPAMPMSARRTSSISSTAARPRSCSAASSPQRKGQEAKWAFNQSSMFLDFLAGNQTFHCTPWGNPTRTYFGWQRPCYLLGEGYAKTFKELMEDDRLGPLRHRQLREMRRLHGAFRLRGDRGDRDDPPAVEGRGAGAARHSHRGPDGAGDPAGAAAAGGIRVQPACRAGADADQGGAARRAGGRRGRLAADASLGLQ